MIIDKFDFNLFESPYANKHPTKEMRPETNDELNKIRKNIAKFSLPLIPLHLSKLYDCSIMRVYRDKKLVLQMVKKDDESQEVGHHYILDFTWEFNGEKEATIEYELYENLVRTRKKRLVIKSSYNTNKVVDLIGLGFAHEFNRNLVQRLKNYIFNDYCYDNQMTHGVNVLRVNCLGGGELYILRNKQGKFLMSSTPKPTVDTNYVDIGTILCIFGHICRSLDYDKVTIGGNIEHISKQVLSYWNDSDELRSEVEDVVEQLLDID